jgi:hypothetical protein
LRFGPQDDRLVGVLGQISEDARLEALFAAAIQSADLDAFRAVLDSGERSE